MTSPSVTDLDDAALRAWPLPMPDEDGDKEERGRVLVIAGSREMPGAAILAATAALRAGAGKLAIATPAGVAQLIASDMPEARVIALREDAQQKLEVSGIATIDGHFNAILIGPGMQHGETVARFVCELPRRHDTTPLILDACAMDVVCVERPCIKAFERPVLLTPHAGELAHLTGRSKEDILAAPEESVLTAARQWNALVALKGKLTLIAAPDGRLWRHEGGNVGLATSGSGDSLAGLIAGLAARGASLEQACAWGVALHARAGDRLAERFGPLGYLAREIADEIPRVMHALSFES
jgi:ADP-dependent NAD(P)H-hydrate dehydratase